MKIKQKNGSGKRLAARQLAISENEK